MKSSWREYARPIIARVIAENKDKDLKEIRRALREAYPFGERAYHPYKIWLSECAIQLHEKKNYFGKKKSKKKQTIDDPKQIKMF